MAQYDIFFQNEHPKIAQRFLTWLNFSLFQFLKRNIVSKEASKVRILEIGPGKGYFYQAISKAKNVSYVACDRNISFRQSFPEAEFYLATAPSFPENIGTFDMIYASYVVEHLSDGLAVAELLRGCLKHLNPGGIVVITCPNALAQKFEFWNMDYTHRYPTTARNMHMAFLEAGFSSTEIYEISGLLTFPGFTFRPFQWCLKVVLFFYRYRVMHFFFGWILKKKLYELNNSFYRLYCLVKQENLLCIGKK